MSTGFVIWVLDEMQDHLEILNCLNLYLFQAGESIFFWRDLQFILHINFVFGLILGVIEALCKYYQNDNKDVRRVWLSTGVDHFHSSVGDRGWGCGYRNFQMLLSSLLQNSLYNDCLRGIKQYAAYLFHIPWMTTN